MQALRKFHPGQPARKVNSQLKSALEIKDKAHQSSLDWFGEILHRKLYLELGYSSVNQYAMTELGFSLAKTGHYISLTRKLEKLPKLKESLSNGDFGYTVARVVADVADSSNEHEWVDFAKNNSRRQVEEEVKRAKQIAKDEIAGQPALLPAPNRKPPQAVLPVRVSFEMTPIQFARYEKLWENVRKNRSLSAEKVEALLEVMQGFLEQQSTSDAHPNHSPGRHSAPPTQIHIHHCPECESATVQTSNGELAVGKQELEQLKCDHQVSRPGQRNKTAIPPAIRREVFTNARHKCETPGCQHTRFLAIHHIVPRIEGGGNELGNMKLLCTACHRLVHRSHLLVMEPLAKESLVAYQFRQ